MLHELSALSRRRFLGLTGAASLGLLGACGGQTPSAGSRAGGSAVEPMTISTCVYAKNHASSPLFWQQFAPEGVTVEVTPIASSAEVQSGLESGQFDAGLMGVYNTITAGSETITSKLIGMVSRQGLGLIGRTGEVEDVASLRGKKVAVPPPGVQVLVLTQMLEAAGLELGKDVTAIPLGYADHPTALERGDVQAYIGTEPLCTQSVVSGVGVRVPGAYDTPLADFDTGLWASSTVLQDPDKTRLTAEMDKAAAEHLTPGGENDPEVWRELLVTQFGYDERVYEDVLATSAPSGASTTSAARSSRAPAGCCSSRGSPVAPRPGRRHRGSGARAAHVACWACSRRWSCCSGGLVVALAAAGAYAVQLAVARPLETPRARRGRRAGPDTEARRPPGHSRRTAVRTASATAA